MTRALLTQALDALELPSMKTERMLIQRDVAIEAIRTELAKPDAEPVAWIFDWYAEPDDGGDGPIRDWLTTSYDEAHSPTMGCHNIRPLA